MGDRATLEKIYAIMRRLLLVKMDGLNPIPRKGTTRHECYRALYEIQELLGTHRFYGKHLPQTNADRIRSMSDEELAELFSGWIQDCGCNSVPCKNQCKKDRDSDEVKPCADYWLDWLRQEAPHDQP